MSGPADDATSLAGFPGLFVRARLVGTWPYLFPPVDVVAGEPFPETWELDGTVHREAGRWLALRRSDFLAGIRLAARCFRDPRDRSRPADELVREALSVEVPRGNAIRFEPRRQSWDYADERVVSLRDGLHIRVRAALDPGWEFEVLLRSTLPRVLSGPLIERILRRAGQLGIGHGAPEFGRFRVAGFEVVQDDVAGIWPGSTASSRATQGLEN